MRALLLAMVLITQPELLDRTLALVGSRPITLSDVRAALALGLIDPRLGASGPAIGDTVGALINRELILREVQRYAPAPPTESAVDARIEEIRKRLASGASLERVLDANGISEVRLRAWVRDDLRGEAYLAQRFASASSPTEAEISTAYAESRAQFDQTGQTFEQASTIIRDRLIAARRQSLILDWILDLRRRTDVVILPD